MRRTLHILIAIGFILSLVNPVFASLSDTETTGVVISHNEIEVVIGTTEQLRARVEPENATNKNISWVSSDEDIVTVRSTGLSSAEIRAEGGGEAWVTVITEDNEFRASCKVKVVVPVSRVYMEKAELSLETGEKYQFEAFFVPEDATNQKLAWASSDNLVVGVDENGLAEALSPGTARIVARSDESEDIYTYCTVTVDDAAAGDDTVDDEIIDENREEEAENVVEDEAIDQDAGSGVGLNYTYLGAGAVIIILLILILFVQRKRRTG